MGVVNWLRDLEPTPLSPSSRVFPRSAFGASRFGFFRYLSSFSARCGGSPILRCPNSLRPEKTLVRDQRVIAVAAVISGLILAPLVAATPAWVPALLGVQWNDAVRVIPPACLHLMVIGPIVVALTGFLFAVGDASAVLRSALVAFPLMFAVMIPLLMVIGVPAVGYGWIAWGIGEGVVLVRSARKHAEFSIRPSLMPPTIFAIIGATIGWLVASMVGTTVVGGLAGALFAAAVYLVALWVSHRSYLLDSVHLFARGLSHVLRSQAPK